MHLNDWYILIIFEIEISKAGRYIIENDNQNYTPTLSSQPAQRWATGKLYKHLYKCSIILK